MGLKETLARRRNENRIKRRTLLSNKPNAPDPEAELDAMINNVGNRVYRAGKRIVDNSQKRKQEGRRLLIAGVKSGIGQTTRMLVGPPKSKVKKPNRKQRRR